MQRWPNKRVNKNRNLIINITQISGFWIWLVFHLSMVLIFQKIDKIFKNRRRKNFLKLPSLLLLLILSLLLNLFLNLLKLYRKYLYKQKSIKNSRKRKIKGLQKLRGQFLQKYLISHNLASTKLSLLMTLLSLQLIYLTIRHSKTKF